MERILNVIRSPGARDAVESAAPTQGPLDREHDVEGADTTYLFAPKRRTMDRWLDRVVEFSGSQFVFFLILSALLTWAFLGIPFGLYNDWQVGISDAQAVVNMVFDAFLMRQQLNHHKSLMKTSAYLRSRISSNKRMLAWLIASGQYEKLEAAQIDGLKQTEFASELPAENWLGRISTSVSNAIGHIGIICLYWIGIFIWLGFGQYCGWTNTWQLYINSGTSALMVFVLAFLANIRERHSKYTTQCLERIHDVDAALEAKLRIATGDRTENERVVISVPQRSRIQRAIDYYADLVGTLTGIAILILFMTVWVAIGPVLQFDSNWWLLIGTYAGLVGLNDGFVLRNVQNVLSGYQGIEFTQISDEDMELLALIGILQFDEECVAVQSLSCRISVAVGNFCSHEYTVLLGVVTIIGLVSVATAMGWSVTGQLICNVPPSIIESFFMMILITGHNVGDAKMRIDLFNIHLRRLKLISYVNTLVKVEKEIVFSHACEVTPQREGESLAVGSYGEEQLKTI